MLPHAYDSYKMKTKISFSFYHLFTFFDTGTPICQICICSNNWKPLRAPAYLTREQRNPRSKNYSSAQYGGRNSPAAANYAAGWGIEQRGSPFFQLKFGNPMYTARATWCTFEPKHLTHSARDKGQKVRTGLSISKTRRWTEYVRSAVVKLRRERFARTCAV
jgi:hypothetical protein